MMNARAQAQLCEDMSLARAIPALLRDQARHELRAHLKTAPELFSGWRSQKMTFRAPTGWVTMNPSVTRVGSYLRVAQRCCNYEIDDRGPYPIVGTPPYSRTFLLAADPKTLNVTMLGEVRLPLDERKNEAAQAGFEDMRIIEHDGHLCGVFTRCDQNEEGWTEQWLARIDGEWLADPKRLKPPGPRRHEKNWIPFVVNDGRLLFVYTCDPTVVIDENGNTITVEVPRIAADHFRGSSQGLPFKDGLLALVHHTMIFKLWPKIMFRFVWFDAACRMRMITDAFTFPSNFEADYLNGYQYAMGLCWHPDEENLVVSYQIGERQGYLAMMEAEGVWSKMREI